MIKCAGKQLNNRTALNFNLYRQKIHLLVIQNNWFRKNYSLKERICVTFVLNLLKSLKWYIISSIYCTAIDSQQIICLIFHMKMIFYLICLFYPQSVLHKKSKIFVLYAYSLCNVWWHWRKSGTRNERSVFLRIRIFRSCHATSVTADVYATTLWLPGDGNTATYQLINSIWGHIWAPFLKCIVFSHNINCNTAELITCSTSMSTSFCSVWRRASDSVKRSLTRSSSSS